MEPSKWVAQAALSALCVASCATAWNEGRDVEIQRIFHDFESAQFFWEQREIARELIAIGDPEIIRLMKPLLVVSERARRCNAAYVIAGLGDDSGIDIIIQELRDESQRPVVYDTSLEQQILHDRYYAALLLGSIKSTRAVPALIEATRDPTINYRAAVSLGEIGDPRAVPAIRAMIDASPGERLWAGWGLAALNEQEGYDILVDVALHDPSWSERRHAVEALGKLGDATHVPVVARALKDEHSNVRVSAARALAAIGDLSALPALTEALSDTETPPWHAPTTVEKEARLAIQRIMQSKD